MIVTLCPTWGRLYYAGDSQGQLLQVGLLQPGGTESSTFYAWWGTPETGPSSSLHFQRSSAPCRKPGGQRLGAWDALGIVVPQSLPKDWPPMETTSQRKGRGGEQLLHPDPPSPPLEYIFTRDSIYFKIFLFEYS